MPVKNVGSRLARGVRQIKEQQDSAATAAAPVAVIETAPVAAEVKTVSPRPRVKPVPAKPGKSGIAHPDRVWPD